MVVDVVGDASMPMVAHTQPIVQTPENSGTGARHEAQQAQAQAQAQAKAQAAKAQAQAQAQALALQQAQRKLSNKHSRHSNERNYRCCRLSSMQTVALQQVHQVHSRQSATGPTAGASVTSTLSAVIMGSPQWIHKWNDGFWGAESTTSGGCKDYENCVMSLFAWLAFHSTLCTIPYWRARGLMDISPLCWS